MIKEQTRFVRLFDRVSGWHLVLIAIMLTLLFAGTYTALEKFSSPNGLVCSGQTCPANFLTSLYFSITTETTLGYGDISPIGVSRLVACVQVMFGLIFAGLAVAKITSLEGRALRLIAHRVAGEWVEFTRMPDGRYMVSFSTFAPGGGGLLYDGENFNEKGEPIGFFTGSLLGGDGNILRFQYSNRDSTEAYFSEGHCNLKFRSEPKTDRWATFRGTVHDFAHNDKIDYNGRRATIEESGVINGMDIHAREELAKLVATTLTRK